MRQIKDSMVHPNAQKFGLIEGHVAQVCVTEKPSQKALVFTGVVGCDLDGNQTVEMAGQLVLFLDQDTLRTIADQVGPTWITVPKEPATSWQKLRPGRVWQQGSGWIEGQNRITYRLRDSEGNIDYLSISARGKDPFHHVDFLTLEIRDGKYFVECQPARQEKGIDV